MKLMKKTWPGLANFLLLISMTAAGQGTKTPAVLSVYTPWGDVQGARLLKAVPARLPPGQTLAEGKRVTALDVVVGADGVPVRADVINLKPSPLDASAVAAVRECTFEPGSLKGSPVPVHMVLWVPFLDTDHAATPIPAVVSKTEHVIPPRAINEVEAQFSEEARHAGVSGTVLLKMIVTEDGQASNVGVMRPLGYGLDEQARKAALEYRFRPATLDGVAVPMPIVIEVKFRLGPA